MNKNIENMYSSEGDSIFPTQNKLRQDEQSSKSMDAAFSDITDF